MGLDLDNVAALHDVEDRRMTLDDFLTVVVDCNTQVKGHAESTVTQLCQLFHKIDHDEDGVITWTEFTSFVLETMRGYSEQLLVDGLHEVEAHDGHSFIGFEQHSKVFQVFDASRNGAVVATSAPCTGGHLVDVTTVPPWDYIVGTTTSTTINFWDGREYALRQVPSVTLLAYSTWRV
ncbi:hypothetical protein DYB28_015521 [Aphanomyces astaci]|uniref:EF-hand domain-containing protein n=1 Tax=Aphanomyces astaci TaxID=112090 RepID=A0A397FIS4_APHAT|nr:hypothetical protein DYB31_010328 [Aphanomyces astaci]RLO01573.1 hypothetical protein DYB28_015521 [Aphanomyces astaci]